MTISDRMLLMQILKLVVSIKFNFMFYWSPTAGIPLGSTAAIQQFNKDACHQKIMC